MDIKTSKLYLGAAAPFTFYHMSDTHLILVDERDDERKRSLPERRRKLFPNGLEYLKEAAEISKADGNSLIVHTGDLIDFVSEANLEAAKKFISETNCLMIAGNHEFTQYVFEVVKAADSAEYRSQTFDKVQAAFLNDIRFTSKEINGINLVCIDNSYNLFEPWQLEALKKEVQKGMPIILFMHIPLYNEEVYEYCTKFYNTVVGDLICVPEDKLEKYPPERYEQQKGDALTFEMFEYIKHEPLIKAIFSGHEHFDFKTTIDNRLPQYVTGISTLRKIHVI